MTPRNCKLGFTYGYRRGNYLYDLIQAEMIGRIATSRMGCRLLAEVIARVPGGIHVEIGSHWGGTAILAAMLQNSSGMVYAIDPIGKNGFYGGMDPFTHLVPSPESMQENFITFDVSKKIKHIDEFSHPWPVNIQMDTAFIDGDHSFPVVLHDWMNIRERCSEYVVFDNVEREFPHVEEVFSLACNDPGWELAALVQEVGVVKRVKQR